MTSEDEKKLAKAYARWRFPLILFNIFWTLLVFLTFSNFLNQYSAYERGPVVKGTITKMKAERHFRSFRGTLYVYYDFLDSEGQIHSGKSGIKNTFQPKGLQIGDQIPIYISSSGADFYIENRAQVNGLFWLGFFNLIGNAFIWLYIFIARKTYLKFKKS